MAKTKGHVTRVTGGDWHPTKRNEMLTCSVDGTVRLWDLNGKKSFDNLICKHVGTQKRALVSSPWARVALSCRAWHWCVLWDFFMAFFLSFA